MSEFVEVMRAIREERKGGRAQLREQGAEMLRENNIPFVVCNGGAHLVVEGHQGLIDFWPGTRRWMTRRGGKGFGAEQLIAAINAKTV